MLKLPVLKRNIFPSITYGIVILATFFVFHYTLVAIENRTGSVTQQESSLVFKQDDHVAESESSGQGRRPTSTSTSSTSFPVSKEKTKTGINQQKKNSKVSFSEKKERKSNDSKKKPKKKYGALVAKARDLRQDVDKSKKKKKVFLQDEVVDLSNDWTDEMMETQAKVHRDRAAMVNAACKKMKDDRLKHPDMTKIHENLRWVTKYDFIWCPVYKAASTTWMSNLLLLAGIKQADKSIHKLVEEMYSPPKSMVERERLLENSLKLLIVRHPLERLLSAYRDKMLRDDQFKNVQKTILEKFPDEKAKENNGHPTFRQFLGYIQSCMRKFSHGKGTHLNPHWQPVWVTCAPCQVDYDVIAHVESLTLDQEYIIRKAGLTNLAVNAHTHASNYDHYNGTNTAAKLYFSQVPKSLIREVAAHYRTDFELFGYSPDAYIEMGSDDKSWKYR